MPQAVPSTSAAARPRRRDARPAPPGSPWRRSLRTGGVAALAGLLLLWPPPVLAPGVACGPVDADTAVVTVGALADDGALTDVERRTVGPDGEVCVTDTDPPTPTVDVGVLHTDADGRSREATELGRLDDPITTLVEARDVTATSREVEVLGPLGATTAQRRVGLPQLVRVEITYPEGWDVQAADGDGVATAIVDGRVEVSRTAVLFPPLLDATLALRVQATPGRGTPSVAVEASPLAGIEPFVLPAGVLEQDALAVVGALASVGQDGADQVAEGATSLADGAGELAEGTSQLATGVGELAGGSAGVADGAGQLAGGAGELAGGAGELADGTRQLAGGLEDSAAGSAAVAEGAERLDDGAAPLAAAAGELATGAQELSAGADALAAGLAGGDAGQGGELDVGSVLDGLAELQAGIAGVRDDLSATLPSEPDPADPVAVAVATLTGLAEAAGTLAVELETGLGSLGTALEGLEEAAAGATELADGAAELAAGGADLAAGVEEVATGVTELATATAELADGLGQLTAASDELSAGASGVATGTAGLAEGAGELVDGAREVAAGSAELADGSEEVAAGADDLAEGSDELAEGARELPEVLAEAVGVADRSGQEAATTLAVLDAGGELAREHVGEAALRTLQLRHAGQSPFPIAAAAGTGASVLVLLLGLLGLLRRRWGRR